MATKDQQTGDKGAAEGDTNVVRLPRDWLGSREELVPFGPHAGPPSAADFWGEESAAVQDALQAPDREAEAVDEPRGAVEREAPAPSEAEVGVADVDEPAGEAVESGRIQVDHVPSKPRRFGASPPWPRRISSSVSPAAESEAKLARPGRRRGRVAAVCALAAAIAVVVLLAAGGQRAGGPTSNGAASPGRTWHVSTLALGGRVGRAIGHVKASVRARRHQTARRVVHPRRVHRASHVAAYVASSPQPASSAAGTVSGSGTGSGNATSSSSSSGAGGSARTSGGETGSGGGSGGGGGGGGGGAPSGPVGRGAPFGPGRLG